MEIQREARDPYRAMVALDRAVGLDEQLHLLVKLRASLVNGCAYCIDLHSKEGLEAGESQERLFGLAAWAEAPYYSERERAALALTDAITLIAEGRVPDDVWEKAERHFEPAGLAQLVWAITAINAWNRIGISTRMVPGT
jgi:AhpD family alkylhydroperoxidase